MTASGPDMSLDSVLRYLEGTSEDAWLTDRCRSKDGSKNCVIGHIFDYGGGDDGDGSVAVDLFEEIHATTHMVFPVNDGEHPDYPQKTPKQRIVAYLRNMRDGREPSTLDLLQAHDEEFEALQ